MIQAIMTMFCSYWLVFYLPILWCSQSGDHPENKLAKFGYIPEMKVLKKKDPSSLKIWQFRKKKSIKIWQIWPIVLMKNPVYVDIILFRSKFGKNLPVRKITPTHSTMLLLVHSIWTIKVRGLRASSPGAWGQTSCLGVWVEDLDYS
jgi:hypothetical protein